MEPESSNQSAQKEASSSNVNMDDADVDEDDEDICYLCTEDGEIIQIEFEYESECENC